jgi:putative hemolysin
VLAVVKAKDLLGRCLAGEPLDLRASMKQPLFVPVGRSALQVLELFKSAHTHIALVIDEYGAVEGLVTMNDVLEAIVGDMPAAGGTESYAVKREDGSWLLDGALLIEEFKEIFPVGDLPGEDRGRYQTLAGFVLMYLGRVPKTADYFEWQGLRFEIVDMDGHRIDKVMVMDDRIDSSNSANNGN